MSQSTPVKLNPAAAVLWASAFIIAALVLVTAGQRSGNPAHAEMVSSRGDYIMMTTGSGRGDAEVLYVIDTRQHVLYAYEVEDGRRGVISLRDGGSLDSMFRMARQ